MTAKELFEILKLKLENDPTLGDLQVVVGDDSEGTVREVMRADVDFFPTFSGALVFCIET